MRQREFGLTCHNYHCQRSWLVWKMGSLWPPLKCVYCGFERVSCLEITAEVRELREAAARYRMESPEPFQEPWIQTAQRLPHYKPLAAYLFASSVV